MSAAADRPGVLRFSDYVFDPYCMDCDVNTQEIGEFYMVDWELWEQAVPGGKGMLCIGCLEARLGRRLEPTDFPELVTHHRHYDFNSRRLLDRSGMLPPPGRFFKRSLAGPVPTACAKNAATELLPVCTRSVTFAARDHAMHGKGGA